MPHLVAVLVFTVVSFVYFYPVLEGRKINAHDTKVYEGSSKEISDYRAEYGKEPLWTNSMFGGMPAYMISAKYPGNLFKHLDDLLKIYKTPVAALFLSMLGFYICSCFSGSIHGWPWQEQLRTALHHTSSSACRPGIIQKSMPWHRWHL